MFKFVRVMAKESVYALLDVLYRFAELFIEWYYDRVDGK